jgi:hypothetical protein
MSVVALGTFKGAEVKTHACRHDASEHHVSLALWAGGAMDESADVFGQGMGFWHDASLKEAGAQHSQSPACACEVDSGDATTLNFRRLIRCSILIGFWQEMGLAEYRLSGIVGILRQLDRLLIHVQLRDSVLKSPNVRRGACEGSPLN